MNLLYTDDMQLLVIIIAQHEGETFQKNKKDERKYYIMEVNGQTSVRFIKIKKL